MACVLCGGERHAVLTDCTRMINSSFEGAAVVRCAACGFDYLSPTPPQVADVYEADYFQAYRDQGIVFPTESALPRHAARLEAVREITGRPGRLLEVGIGHGGFMQLAASRGWTPTGVEISRYAARHVREQFGHDVVCGSIETADLPAGAFDLVHLSHVLEHLVDPVAALVRIRGLLSPSGVMVIEVPNELENLFVRARRLVGRVTPYPVTSTHLSFFTPATLQRALQRAGFRVLRLTTLRDVSDPRLVRRIAKAVVGTVERGVGRGPLIEAFAVPADRGRRD
jgi:2-polyprenyl-3-methyl-5-hydroxy-6-metoxy-1,4-benzoquinol methylase